MRYIKPFNESTQTDWVNSIKEFCEINLAYLIDDGLTIRVTAHYTNERQEKDWDRTKLCYVVLGFDHKDIKKWNIIKDSIIPFFIRLSRSFNVPYFDHLPGLTSDRISAGLSAVPENLRGHQLQMGLIGLDKLYRRNFSINDLDDLDGLGGSSLENCLVSTITFYVSEVSLVEPVIKDNSFKTRIKKFLGFRDTNL